MNDYSEYILQLLCKKDFVDQWIQGKYKEKPIIIYGRSGIGKTTLANYILRQFIKIEINIDFCKNCKSLENYLDMSVKKESITMMFEKKKIKCILFDDLKYIQENDKLLFKQIINFAKKKNNYPVIYIFNTISHKLIHSIYVLSYPIKIDYTIEQYKVILKKFYFQKDEMINYYELITKSEYNFHNILINKSFYQKDTTDIQKMDCREDDLSLLLRNIYNMKNINDKFRHSVNDYNILSLNILENCISWIYRLKISYRQRINLIHKIYSINCTNDIFYNKINRFKLWELINYNITYSVIIPIYILSQHNASLDPIIYNKYISHSIIYTHNIKQLHSVNINYITLSCIFCLIQKKEFTKARKFCNLYQINQKICEKFYKYFLTSKKDIKLIFKNI
tara:strand:+ start:7712 stop:8893 length:1182 start_codon:yes stop_codon:yes gene_type:complete